MKHAHSVLALVLGGAFTVGAAACTARQNLGCRTGETCADGGGGNVPTTGMRAFVTAETYDGDLAHAAGTASGIDGANALCQLAADGAGLGGHWAAWISDDTSDAVDRVADDGPWLLVDRTGTAYANRAAVGGPAQADLTDQHGEQVYDTIISQDEFGNPVYATFSAEFWTGSLASGRSSGQDCSRWRSASGDVAIMGSTGMQSGALGVGTTCDDTHHLLCLEQKNPPPPVNSGLTKRVFVTSKAWSGDLKTEGGKSTPQAAADHLCSLAANDAGLGGTWIAWLSARDGSNKMVRAYDRLNDQVTAWTLVDGKTAVFDRKEDLLGKPLHSIDQNEFGGLVPENTPVWTGTLEGGAPAAQNNCQNWSSDYQGDWGINGYANPIEDWSWTGGPSDVEADAGRCADPASLYCFEQ